MVVPNDEIGGEETAPSGARDETWTRPAFVVTGGATPSSGIRHPAVRQLAATSASIAQPVTGHRANVRDRGRRDVGIFPMRQPVPTTSLVLALRNPSALAEERYRGMRGGSRHVGGATQVIRANDLGTVDRRCVSNALLGWSRHPGIGGLWPPSWTSIRALSPVALATEEGPRALHLVIESDEERSLRACVARPRLGQGVLPCQRAVARN